MKILIDMQGAQSLNAKRGIGKYIISLVESLVKNATQDEIVLVCNGFFKDSVVDIKTTFKTLLPKQNIKVWLPSKLNKKESQTIFSAFIKSLNPDIILTSSLFEGFSDEAVTIAKTSDQDIPIGVILYDLIPFIYQSPYLDDPKMKEWYLEKTEELKKADILLSISNSSKQEAHAYLNIPDDKVVNISAAVEDIYKPVLYTDSQAKEIYQPYGINKPFVLYTGGIDYRKNIDALIQAFSMLPKQQLQTHQLVIVCSISDAELHRLNRLSKTYNLNENEIIFTNYVPKKTLIALYNLCKVFIFPSLHEGFGLPILEAMQCHKAVISANNSSLIEVLGNEKAMFDAKDINSICSKLNQALTDEDFRVSLQEHSKTQALKFSWDKSATLALKALKDTFDKKQITPAGKKPTLAYISPLPPQKSGISYYSAELLQELSKYYDLQLITDESENLDDDIKQNYKTKTFDYFTQNYTEYQRVLYHFGNSPFHKHMFELLEDIKGVVVLHDFYLSGVVSHLQLTQQRANFWIDELYHSHGYKAVQEYFDTKDMDYITAKYPVNLSVLENAVEVIVHSDYSKNLAKQFYGNDISKSLTTIPHLRLEAPSFSQLQAKRALDLPDDAFIVCSFGLLGETKLNHRLLEVFLSSSLSKNPNCHLVFVGENNPAQYGEKMTKAINASAIKNRITITGWADKKLFNTYLQAASIAVQLRTNSRGETSGTVLDCMSYGIPTIVNANGSMKELDDNAVVKLDDDFNDNDLKVQIEKLFQDKHYRQTLSQNAKKIIQTKYNLATCAKQYYNTIEKAYKDKSSTAVQDLVYKITNNKKDYNDDALKDLSFSIAYNFPPKQRVKQLFVDISELVQRDAKTGIQRVVHNILQQLLKNQPKGYRVQPVYATNSTNGYYHAKKFMAKYLNYPLEVFSDEPIDFYEDDIFLGLDLQHDVVASQVEFLQQMHQKGTKVYFVVYDLLPILLPQTFTKGAKQSHSKWIETVTSFDGAICISKSVAKELQEFIKRPHTISWFHLGAEFTKAKIASDLKKEQNTFLMVGTIEPRKGHAQTLESFELLWEKGIEVKLVIVGKQGWLVDDLIKKINNHPQLNKKLFYLQNTDDKELQKLYKSSTALISASYGEGFGLPLIEASYYNLPIIARDIPIFKEVASNHAYYYRDSKDPKDLSDAVIKWLKLYKDDTYPKSDNIPYLSWAQSANELIKNIIDTRQN